LVFRIEDDQLVEIESDEEFEKVKEAWEALLEAEDDEEEEE